MGQRMSSDNQKVHKSKAKGSAVSSKDVYLLPQEEELLGRCWLLASSADSFSPSRWFALMPSTWEGARPEQRRAFSISRAVLSPAERLRQPALRDLSINVHTGLRVCGFANVTVATLNAAAARQKSSLRVGGLQVPLPPVVDPADSTRQEDGTYVVVAVRRASVEAELRDYATAGLTRHAVQAPPANEEERRAFGEGCITGVLYGAAVVLHVAAAAAGRLDVAPRLAQMCRDEARRAGVAAAALQVQEEAVLGGMALAASAGSEGHPPAASDAAAGNGSANSGLCLHLLSVCCGKEFEAALREAFERGVFEGDAESGGTEEALKAVAQWAVRVHQTPSAWCPMNAFLQRYEAIADSLLVAKKRT